MSRSRYHISTLHFLEALQTEVIYQWLTLTFFYPCSDLLSGHLNKCFYGNECSASSTLEMIISPIVPDITMNMDDSLRLYFIVNSKYLSSRYIQGGHTKLPRRYRTCDCWYVSYI